jgi:hypothetical protein
MHDTPATLKWRACRRHGTTVVVPAPGGNERSWSLVSPTLRDTVASLTAARAASAAAASSAAAVHRRGGEAAGGAWAAVGHDVVCGCAWVCLGALGAACVTVGVPFVLPAVSRRGALHPLWEHTCRLYLAVCLPVHATALGLQVGLCCASCVCCAHGGERRAWLPLVRRRALPGRR